ncbi:MAG: M20/M25/M40 family metallo-hydrolase [Bacillota bacterium]|jgi:acetylornithine deacetylase/succinyl-diaminopimelate desuccinylase-like protein
MTDSRIQSIHVEQVLEHAARNEEQYIADLKALLRIPSVSGNASGIAECVEFLSDHLRGLGMRVRIFETERNPIILAELEGASPKTILFYGHYDVQPPDPIEDWEYPPFAAEESEGRIYARGAVDDKGNFFCIVKAIQSYVETLGLFPCSVKLILEGEEEMGSESIEEFLPQNLDLLKCDDMVWFDGGIHADGRPEVCLGMKGMAYVELSAKSLVRDLHSGKAPLVDNAAWRLVWALNSLYGPDQRIAIPGFYDDVVEPNASDMALISGSGLTPDDILQDWTIERLRSGYEDLSGAELLRRLYFEPTCTICGISAGYGGPGSKTVIPSSASAKVDFRLVPNQDPDDIVAKLKGHLCEQGFGDIEVSVHSTMPASKSDPDADVARKMLDVMRANYGEPVVKPIVEGSGPGCVFEKLGVPYVFARLGPAEDRSHSPNEYTTREAYCKGIATVIQFAAEYSC